ncbi:MAG: hypothetical protein WCS80_01600 [Bacilli bacterium]
MEDKLLKNVKVIKETDSHFTFEKVTKKTALLCTNGFQNADLHDATPMREYFKDSFSDEFHGCEVVPVQLFHPAVPSTHHHKMFEKILEKTILEYTAKGYDIILLGYSFSASLCCKMQAKYPHSIKKLILVAPVYDTILNGMIPGYLNYAFKFAKLSKKYGPKIAKAMGRTTTKGMVSLLISILMSLLTCRSYVKKVTCNTLIFWGMEDELCTAHSLKKVTSKLNVPNIVYKYPGMTHAILKSVKQNGIVYEDILHYAFGTPFIIEKKTESVLKNNEKKIKLDEDGEPIPSFQDIFSEIDPELEQETLEDNKVL